MIFGVGAVISMLSVGEGAEREALRLIDTMGLRTVIVKAKEQPDDKVKETREKSLGLTLHDLDAALETLPFIENHTAIKEVSVYSLFSHVGESDGRVLGVSPSHFAMTHLSVARGRPLVPFDDHAFAQVAVIGSRAAYDLFGNQDPLGQRVRINHLWFTVVGLVADRALTREEFQGVKLSGVENDLYVPVRTALKRFRFKPLEDELDEFHVQVREGVPPGRAAAGLTRLLELRHRAVDDFSLVVPADLLEQHRKTQRIFNLVMASIAGISLLVGGIGIMNIMLANVLERTREIGIRRAVGARRRDIRDQFLIETLTITGLGGILGIVAGLAIAAAIALLSGWQIAWTPRAVLLAVGVCAAVGLASGLYPAVKAARLDPIEALQRE
ncbi:MAG: ABC transporter permease [Acidobacteria bacterium]|nr:ABC transporter permease [Acidobacteriota bacterium]